VTYALQKTTKSGLVSIEVRGLSKERAERLALMSTFADFDGAKYTVVEDR